MNVRKRVYEFAPRDIGAGAFNVLNYLAHLASSNPDPVCWPKLDTIAWNCRMDERQVRRCIVWLEEHAQVIVRRRRGRGNTSVYGVITGLPAEQHAAVERALAAVEEMLSRPEGKPDISDTIPDEKGVEMSTFTEGAPTKSGHLKPDIAIAVSGSATRNEVRVLDHADPDLLDQTSTTTTPLPPTEPTPPAASRAEQQRGGGGESATRIGRNRTSEQPAQAQAAPSANAETVAALQAAGVRVYWQFAHLPAEVVKAAAAQAATARRADDRGALVANLLKAYSRGEWVPNTTTTAAGADDRPRSFSAADPELMALDGYTRGKALQRLRSAETRSRQMEILGEYQARAVTV